MFVKLGKGRSVIKTIGSSSPSAYRTPYTGRYKYNLNKTNNSSKYIVEENLIICVILPFSQSQSQTRCIQNMGKQKENRRMFAFTNKKYEKALSHTHKFAQHMVQFSCIAGAIYNLEYKSI